MPRAATTPRARITQRRAGYQSGLQPRITKAQATVTTMASGQGHPGEDLLAAVPQRGRAHADQGTDGRGQDDGVVRMDDALSEAEGGPGEQEPAAEDQEPGPDPVGPGARRVIHSTATMPMSAPGISHEI